MGASRATATRRTPSRALTALLGIGVLALLAAVWFVVLPEDDRPASPAAHEDDIGAAPGTPAAPVEDGPIETFEVFAPKDPFQPLVATAKGATSGSSDPRKSDGKRLDRATDDDNVGSHSVKLVDAVAQGGGSLAEIDVDDTLHTVEEGERFAENFQLVSVEGACATMLFGDEQFTTCEGEQILK